MAVEGLTQLNVMEFRDNLTIALQQTQSLLRGKVFEQGGLRGKQAALLDYESPVSMRAPAGRFAPMNRVDSQYTRRWVTPVDKDLPELVDRFDLLRIIQDPRSNKLRDMAAAIAREWDDQVILNAFATALISNAEGTTTTNETWANAQTAATGSSTGLTIAVGFGNNSTAIGLTVDKLIEANRIFRHLHVTNPELAAGEKTLVIGSTQEADLLKQVEIVSTEFMAKRILEKGTLDGEQFLGWNVVVSERLQYGSSVRQCIALVRNGMGLGVWEDMQMRIDERTDLSSIPYQLYAKLTAGATRLEPGRVLEIDCADTVTGDNI